MVIITFITCFFKHYYKHNKKSPKTQRFQGIPNVTKTAFYYIHYFLKNCYQRGWYKKWIRKRKLIG